MIFYSCPLLVFCLLLTHSLWKTKKLRWDLKKNKGISFFKKIELKWKSDLEKWMQKEFVFLERLLVAQPPAGRWYGAELKIFHGPPTSGRGDGCDHQEKNYLVKNTQAFYLLLYQHPWYSVSRSDCGHFSLPKQYFLRKITPPFHQSKRFSRVTITSPTH